MDNFEIIKLAKNVYEVRHKLTGIKVGRINNTGDNTWLFFPAKNTVYQDFHLLEIVDMIQDIKLNNL